MLSVVIPSYVEPYLNKTICSLLENATGEIEIIPVIDGWVPSDRIPDDSRVKPIFSTHRGMRASINAGVEAAKGDYIAKVDAHCAFSPGFDEVLTADCQEEWLMVPTCYRMDEWNWIPNKDYPKIEYCYLSFPGTGDPAYGPSLLQVQWQAHPPEWNDREIDDTMNSLVGCWVANKEYYLKHIHPLNDSSEAYGPHTQECLELGLKYWLGGGAVKVNKRAWYAHLWKRPWHFKHNIFSTYHRKNHQTFKSCLWATQHWMNNREPNMVYKFEWLIDKFWPIPTWQENWKEIWAIQN